jgi:hypothetical protein
MTHNQEKLKISGLVVVAVLLVLISRQQQPRILSVQPRGPAVLAEQVTEIAQTGTIAGTVTYPEKEKTRQVSVCAVNDSTHANYCVEKVKTSYELVVPVGTYLVYATMADNPRDINAYRAYYAQQNNAPIKVEVKEGQIVADINPGDWDYLGDENIIALINEEQKKVHHYQTVAADSQIDESTIQQPLTPAQLQEQKQLAGNEPTILDDKGGYGGDAGESHQDDY